MHVEGHGNGIDAGRKEEWMEQGWREEGEDGVVWFREFTNPSFLFLLILYPPLPFSVSFSRL